MCYHKFGSFSSSQLWIFRFFRFVIFHSINSCHFNAMLPSFFQGLLIPSSCPIRTTFWYLRYDVVQPAVCMCHFLLFNRKRSKLYCKKISCDESFQLGLFNCYTFCLVKSIASYLIWFYILFGIHTPTHWYQLFLSVETIFMTNRNLLEFYYIWWKLETKAGNKKKNVTQHI